ncbi:putative disease resistance RPP13-like protein 3 [Macadamia integrifolia]|uniref:putative disease resistance RPP13-like protein 3 n=1 Tax=Macadamia integrifolia TaxID=60698 RepID=UPI001C4E640F|nr:putative disease resistance RPP13-like protein 3 [Macadamia integrifolia]
MEANVIFPVIKKLGSLLKDEAYSLYEAEGDEDKLAKLLMKEEPRVPTLGVVSITGMGGLGKTTLAKQINNRDDVKRHFDCQAWVSLSKEYKIEDVLLDMIKQVEVLTVLTVEQRRGLESSDVKILKARLSKSLENKKKYLFVIDDIWEIEDWEKLKESLPFPRNNQKCRVLLTTRDDRVARYDRIALSFKCLDKKKSLELFFKVVSGATPAHQMIAMQNQLSTMR